MPAFTSCSTDGAAAAVISVLIPVYNFDVRPLVESLARQCSALELPWEIVCLDDGSTEAFRSMNRSLQAIPGVRYEELPQNVGRSAIRNHLADRASFPYLLFMDCDSAVLNRDYMAQYAARRQPDVVLYGGRVYAAEPPENADFLLHWTVGKAREEWSAERRAKRPWHAFMTNNFLIAKEIFQSIRFDERLREYGHEDTLFGMELERRRVPVLHLDNPLEHIGLESAEVFLRKSELAVQNLLWLREQGIVLPTRLLTLSRLLEKAGLRRLLRFVLSRWEAYFRRNLLSDKPVLRYLDALKLGWMMG